jgi:hypothetical protein
MESLALTFKRGKNQMTTTKYFCLPVICLLLGGLTLRAPAQQEALSYPGGIQGQSGPVGMATVNAGQISNGQLAFNYQTQTDTTFDVGFLGQTAGDFPGTLTVSLNIASTDAVRTIKGMSATTIPGGIWTLPVYRVNVRDGFVGSLYGTITGGEIVQTNNPDKSGVSMTFVIQGGTLAYQGATGTASFTGTLSVDERGNGSELEGTLVFNGR